MARPSRCRRICKEPEYTGFEPVGICAKENVLLSIDEYEALRLMDVEKLTHEQCAAHMCISRTTVTEIYAAARAKIADCIVNGRKLHIEGGNYAFCAGGGICGKKNCRSKNIEIENQCPTLREKGYSSMRIAVTYENGEIFQHFGHTAQFMVYDVENGTVKAKTLIDTNGSGHGALAGLLNKIKADALICGGIGMGAQNALAQAGIKLYGGVAGSCDKAVEALINNTLAYSASANCNHHHVGEHSCGEHSCGEHSCGEHSCGEHSCGENKNGCAGNH